MTTIALDARMVHHSGIGTHIRGMSEALHALSGREGTGTGIGSPTLAFMGDPDLLNRYPYFRNGGLIRGWRASIYSASEQFAMPLVSEADAYHFPHYNVPQILRPRRPFAVTIHDLIHVLFPEVAGSRAKWAAGRLLMGSATRRAQVVVTVSECSRRDISRVLGVPEEEIVITPNAVHPTFQPVDSESVEQFRRKLSLPERFLLAVGIHKPHKNLEFLIGAFLRWKQSGGGVGSDVKLALCGLRESEQIVLAALVLERGGEAGELAEVLFVPYLEHGSLPALYQAAEALVFPSLYEGFGLPVLEAQRVGTPVIATSASSVPEVAGRGALYFDPRSERELVARLDEYFSGSAADRSSLVAAGRENERRFSWERSARILLEVYQRFP